MIDYPDFWAQLRDKITDTAHPYFGRAPQEDHMNKNELNVGAKRRGYNWKFKLNQRDAAVAIELYIDMDGPQTNKDYAWLLSHQAEIEREFGEPLVWDSVTDAEKRRRIRHILYAKDTVNLEDSATWDTVQRAMIAKSKQLHEVFKPYIEQLRIEEQS